MRYLNGFDYGVIVVYFAILISLGLYLKKKASSSMEDYFLPSHVAVSTTLGKAYVFRPEDPWWRCVVGRPMLQSTAACHSPDR